MVCRSFASSILKHHNIGFIFSKEFFCGEIFSWDPSPFIFHKISSFEHHMLPRLLNSLNRLFLFVISTALPLIDLP